MTLDRGGPPDGRADPILTNQELLELAKLRELFFSPLTDGPVFAEDRPTSITVAGFLRQIGGSTPPALCRCLVCSCTSTRTVTHPVVCRKCSAGAHQPPQGGVL